jgi:hypothetical protein
VYAADPPCTSRDSDVSANLNKVEVDTCPMDRANCAKWVEKDPKFSAQIHPQFFCLRRKEAQKFRLRRRFPPPKSRLHIYCTPPTRADAWLEVVLWLIIYKGH